MGYASNTITNFTDALNAVTRASVEPNKVYDQTFDDSPLFGVLKKNCVKEERGGLFIQRNFNIGKSPNSGWYTGAGGWKMAKFDGIVPAGWDWKFAHDGVVVLGPELVLNSGSDEAIVDLVQARVDVTALSLPDVTATDFFRNNPYGNTSDGTAGNPASIEGLAVLVDDGTISTNVGALSRTTYPSLKSAANYNIAGANALLSALQTLSLSANRGQASRVGINLTTPGNIGLFWGLLQTPERYTISVSKAESIGLKTTGGNDLAFNDTPVLLDEHCPTGVKSPLTASGSGGLWYGLNLDTFQLIMHPDRSFAMSDWYKDQDGDQYFLDIFLAAALLCTQPKKNYVGWVSGG